MRNELKVHKLIIAVYSSPKGSRDNQFAPFRVGVNELIFRIEEKNQKIIL